MQALRPGTQCLTSCLRFLFWQYHFFSLFIIIPAIIQINIDQTFSHKASDANPLAQVQAKVALSCASAPSVSKTNTGSETHDRS